MLAPRSATQFDADVGAAIRATRMAKHISQERLAEAIDVTFQQVQKYEKGINRLSLSRALDICEALGVELSDLLPKKNRRAA